MNPQDLIKVKEGIFNFDNSFEQYVNFRVDREVYSISVPELKDIAGKTEGITSDRIKEWLSRDRRKKLPKDFQDIKIILIESQMHLERYNLRKMLSPEEIAWKKAEKEDDAMTVMKWLRDDYGIKYTEVQHYQIRLENDELRIDIYPQSRKYHDIANNRRGYYKNLTEFLMTYFNLSPK